MIKPVLAIALLLATVAPAAAATDAACEARIRTTLTNTFLSGGPYEMTNESMTASGPYKSIAQVVPGTGMHMVHHLNDRHYDEIFVLDGRAWRNIGRGFSEVPVATTSYSYMTNPAPFIARALQRPACLGLFEIDGREYQGYRLATDVPGYVVDTTIYVDVATNLTARAEVTTVGPEQTTTSVATFRYDPTITIALPPSISP